MKKSFLIIPALALLTSCGGGHQTQNSGTASDTTNSKDVINRVSTTEKPTETPAEISDTEYTGKYAIPELVFEDLKYQEVEYLKDVKVPEVVKTAKRIVIKGDQIKISDGKNETVCKIDLESSSEEANPDGYYWMYSIKDNQPITSGFYIVAEYEEACIARNEDPKKRPISLYFSDGAWLYPKNFNSWDNLKRKITKDYPSDEKYNEELQYINREEPDLSDLEEDYEYAFDGTGVAMQVWNILLKSYDPFGMLSEDEKPSEEMIAENRKHIQEKSITIAVFTPEAEAEGFEETVACYWLKNGNWIILDYWQSLDSPQNNLTVYDFDNTNLTPHDDYFPQDFLKNAYISNIYNDSFILKKDDKSILYSWNNERFLNE